MVTILTKLFFYFCGIFDTHPPRLTPPQFPHRPRDAPSRGRFPRDSHAASPGADAAGDAQKKYHILLIFPVDNIVIL